MAWLLAGSSVLASSPATPPSASLGFRIVVPPHCFELLPGEQAGALREVLAARRLLCRAETGQGRPVHLQHTHQAPEGLRLLPGPGLAPNALHRPGD